MGGAISILHVRHVQDELVSEFDQLIDLNDLPPGAPESERQSFFLTRALAAFTVRQVTGCSPGEAAAAVIDGRDDNGIDAIAVDETEPHLWLIQSKWSRQGVAGFDLGASLKLIQGLDLLLNAEYTRFNSRFQTMADKVDRILRNVHVKITLVPAVLGDASLADEVRQPMEDAAGKLNDIGNEMLDIQPYGLRDFHRAIRADSVDPRVELPAILDGCGWLLEPYLAYYGVMPVEQIAQWHSQHGDRLFEQNIRKSLGLTKVNHSLVETLCTRPNDFWYFNNGITVLCDKIHKNPRFGTSPNAQREFNLEGASVVNGAQTVVAITEALRRKPDVAKAAHVWVRLVSLESCPEGFSGEITRATNTQNNVEKRDLAALDGTQVRLRDEFAWALRKTYVIKRGEDEPASGSGCSNIEAALALACAHRNPELSVQALRGGDLLWETGPGGTYSALFGRRLSAHRVWRSVLLRREVERYLAETADSREGRASAIAAHGRFLLAHLVFQRLPPDGIDDPGDEWENVVLPEVRSAAEQALGWLIHLVDTEFGPNSYIVSIFKNTEKCWTLADLVRQALRAGAALPEMPAAYMPVTKQPRSRQAKAVSVLVDAGAIQEGTPLEFRPMTKEERRVMVPWLAEDPRRGRATWVNSRSKPLLWEADSHQYSPTGLVDRMRRQALGSTRAVQGTRYWFVRGSGSLVELADSVRDGEES